MPRARPSASSPNPSSTRTSTRKPGAPPPRTAPASRSKLEKPEQQSIDLATTQFPTQHLVDLLDKADTGDTFYETSLYDGSEDADRAMTTTVIIGKQAEGNNSDPEAPALASLEKDKFWPVDIAYFDESKNGGEEVPEYRISLQAAQERHHPRPRDGLRRFLDDRQAGQSEAVRREAAGLQQLAASQAARGRAWASSTHSCRRGRASRCCG